MLKPFNPICSVKLRILVKVSPTVPMDTLTDQSLTPMANGTQASASLVSQSTMSSYPTKIWEFQSVLTVQTLLESPKTQINALELLQSVLTSLIRTASPWLTTRTTVMSPRPSTFSTPPPSQNAA